MDTSKIRKRMPVATLLDPKIVVPAIGQAFVKLNPATLIKNPVMFVLEVVTALTTVILIRDLFTGGGKSVFEFQIVLWLWFTVLFRQFCRSSGRGTRQGPGRHFAQGAHGNARQTHPVAEQLQEVRDRCRGQIEGRRPCGLRGERRHSRRRRRDRGHCLGQ